MIKNNPKHYHCIGIGGIGVSAVAELLQARGHTISGSDLQSNANTERLKKLGITVCAGHAPQNITGADCVIYSSAISETNPEFVEAKTQKIPLVSRGAILAELARSFEIITIAGTHGKTTTTGLVSHLLTETGHDPCYVVGGIINQSASPVRIGKGKYFVAEVDESDASFLYMEPTYSVVTNIDADHLETYGGDFKRLQQCFLDYLAKIPEKGAAIVCADDPVVRSLMPKIKSRVLSYGFCETADLSARDYQQTGLLTKFEACWKDTAFQVTLNFPGKHNVQNALAAMTIALVLDLSPENIQKAIATFPGVGRRFHGHGKMRLADGQAMVIEDYGHHPCEIKATLDAAKLAWPDKRIVLVFQPHRYTRTRDLYQDFIEVLSQADKLFLLDVYSAGEDPLENFSSLRLLREVALASKMQPDYIADLKFLPEVLYHTLQDNDVVILQGAGNIGSMAKQLLAN